MRNLIEAATKLNETEDIDPQLANLLDQLACKVFGVETVETRNSDRLDFHEIAVWQMQDAVRKAFLLGAQYGNGLAQPPR